MTILVYKTCIQTVYCTFILSRYRAQFPLKLQLVAIFVAGATKIAVEISTEKCTQNGLCKERAFPQDSGSWRGLVIEVKPRGNEGAELIKFVIILRMPNHH